MLALDQFLAGETQAITDYRVLIAADDDSRLPYLHHFSESATGRPLERFEFEERCFSRSALNYLLGLSLLKRHMGGEVPKIVLEVGGGFGTLGEILATSGIGDLRYIDIDIPPMSFIAQTYLCDVLGAGNVATYDQTREQLQIDIGALPLASALCSWQIERLLGTVDLFVNFISFQEMEPTVVQNYLSHVVRLDAKWVLLRNLREGMMVKKGTETYGVEVPILSEDYVRMLPGYILVARNVLPFGYRTVDGFHSELLLLKRKD